jgi:hypothetical protein
MVSVCCICSSRGRFFGAVSGVRGGPTVFPVSPAIAASRSCLSVMTGKQRAACRGCVVLWGVRNDLFSLRCDAFSLAARLPWISFGVLIVSSVGGGCPAEAMVATGHRWRVCGTECLKTFGCRLAHRGCVSSGVKFDAITCLSCDF